MNGLLEYGGAFTSKCQYLKALYGNICRLGTTDVEQLAGHYVYIYRRLFFLISDGLGAGAGL